MTGSVNKFRVDALIGTFGVIAAYVVGVVFIPIITHFYRPEHIGVWQIILGSVTLLTPLATLRFEDAIVLEKSIKSVSCLLSVIMVNTGLVSIGLLIVSYLVGDNSRRLFDLLITKELIWIVLIGVILQSLFMSFSALIIKEKKFKIQAIAKIASALSLPLVALVPLFFFDASNISYIVAALSGILAQVLILSGHIEKKYIPRYKSWSIRNAYRAIVKHRVYPTFMVPYALSQGAVWQLTLVFLGVLFSAATVGAYTVAKQLVFMPVTLLTSGLKHVTFSYASSAPRYDLIVGNRIKKLLINITNISIPFATFIFSYITDAINFALGEGWEQVGLFSRWMLLPAIALMLTSWLDRIYDVYGKQRLAVVLQVFSDIAFLIVLFVCYLFSADAVTAIKSMSIFLAVYNLFWLFVVLSILRFHISFWLSLLFRMMSLSVVFLLLVKQLDAWFSPGMAISMEVLILSLLTIYTYMKLGASR